MVERLKELISELGVTERNFAIKCGIAQNTMNYYMNGKRKLSLEAIEKVLEVFQSVSAEWLLRGNGDMFLTQDKMSMKDINKIIDTIDALNAALSAQGQTIKILKDRIKELESK